MTINSTFKSTAIFLSALLWSLSAQGNTISGTVSLPPGVTAPSSGISIILRSLRFDNVGFGWDRVTIAPGNSAASYSLVFSNDDDRRIVFDCEACGSLDTTTDGGWSNIDGVVGDFSAQTFVGSQDHIVNIQLETADVFSGTLSFPNGLRAKGSESFIVSIKSSARFTFQSFSDVDNLDEGQTSFDFSIGVPASAANDSWKLRFVCLNCEERIEPSSHYATTVNGGMATLESDSAFSFSKDSDYSNISLILIDNEPPIIDNNNKPTIVPMLFLLDDE